MSSLHSLFRDHMVLAAHLPIRVFGYGAPSSVLQAVFDGESAEIKAYTCDFQDPPTWIAEFPARDFSVGHTLKVTFEDHEETVTDISIGEVILLAGQSNMQFKLHESSTPKELWRGNDRIRVFFPDRMGESDRYTTKDGWILCTDDNAGDISAIGYHLAEELSERMDCTVGLINCYQGASVIESWLPRDKAAAMKLPIEECTSNHTYSWNGDGVLYGFAFTVLCPYSMSCVVWYQGESDTTASEAAIYADELSLMVDIWRKDLGNERLPFLIVQIADLFTSAREAFRLIQNAQVEAVGRMHDAYLVESKDICETNEVHPKTKSKLAKRLADQYIEIFSSHI